MGCRVADELRARVSLNEHPIIQSLQTVDDREEAVEDIARVRAIMAANVALGRTHADLLDAIEALTFLSRTSQRAMVGLMIAKAAFMRQESRGAHDRKDYDAPDNTLAKSLYIALKNGKVELV